jgi:hypothetical protein
LSQVVIPKEKLVELKACSVYLDSPEWNGEALVYSNWEETVERLMSTGPGITYLGFLVAKKLVPLTKDEFRALRADRIFNKKEER